MLSKGNPIVINMYISIITEFIHFKHTKLINRKLKKYCSFQVLKAKRVLMDCQDLQDQLVLKELLERGIINHIFSFSGCEILNIQRHYAIIYNQIIYLNYIRS